jgi:hypothetical protein
MNQEGRKAGNQKENLAAAAPHLLFLPSCLPDKFPFSHPSFVRA